MSSDYTSKYKTTTRKCKLKILNCFKEMHENINKKV